MSNEKEIELLEKKEKRERGKRIVRYCEDKPILFNPRFSEALINYMAEGKSYESFAASIGVGIGTINGWAKQHPEFKRAKEISKLASLGKWEDIALMQSMGIIKGNASTLIFMLKNRFSDSYKERQEIEHSGELTFMMNTGIDRSPVIEDNSNTFEAEFNEVEKDSDLL